GYREAVIGESAPDLTRRQPQFGCKLGNGRALFAPASKERWSCEPLSTDGDARSRETECRIEVVTGRSTPVGRPKEGSFVVQAARGGQSAGLSSSRIGVSACGDSNGLPLTVQ